MSGMLKDGAWITMREWEKSTSGHFDRQVSRFRGDLPEEGATVGRYHLYVSYACPWACRVLMVRALKGLEAAISVSAVAPFMGDDGWAFADPEGQEEGEEDPDVDADPVLGARYLREIYQAADPAFTGRVTVPVLWDRERRTIVNNESSDLVKILDQRFARHASRDVELYPEALRPAIDEAMDAIYEPINNGVYRCGFAGTQAAYEESFEQIFAALDHHDELLGRQRYLCGEQLTVADLCLFSTLVRFDDVYYVHFKCNGKLIAQYDNLSAFAREIYQLPGLAPTVNRRHIKQHYYTSHRQLNPRQFVAAGPRDNDFSRPHDRARLPGGPPPGLFV